MSRHRSIILWISIFSLIGQAGWAQTKPGPPPEAIERARQAGVDDGQRAGESEGRAAGQRDGRQAGERDGQRDGFQRCEREMQQREFDRGSHQGYIDGERDGDYKGRRAGARDGQDRGYRDGIDDGTRRADNDAKNAATGPGRQKGIDEANASDATQVGDRQGTIDGDSSALADAERIDYRRGRDDVNREKWAQPVAREDAFDQKPAPQIAAAELFEESNIKSLAFNPKDWNIGLARVSGKTLDQQAARPSGRKFPTPEEQQAYEQGYDRGYQRAYATAQREGYNQTYAEAKRRGEEQGCRDARSRDYRRDYDRGYAQGRDQGNRRAYDRAYEEFYRVEYDREFSRASHQAYNDNYDKFYKSHFEAARALAYKERYDELYDAAYRAAFRKKYDEVYPKYAAAAYARGRQDETKDFADRPLRLTGVVATETIANGLYEPGEELRIQFNVRNFGAQVAGSAVKIVLKAIDPNKSVLTESQSSIVKKLEGNSQTQVSQALSFRMNDNADGTQTGFAFEVYLNGKLSDQGSIQIKTQFMMQIAVVQLPDLKEGLNSVLKLKVKNRANISTDSDLNLTLSSDKELSIPQPKQSIGSMAAGEEKFIEYNVISRSHGDRVNLPLGLQAHVSGGRRVGLYSTRAQVPVTNDYRISIKQGVENLATAGVARLEYEIQNRSARDILNSLQMELKVKGEGESNFAVLGPNPQFLSPMLPGQVVNFVIPVMVKDNNVHGLLELSVKENGRTVVIHQREF